jgi:UDP-glucose 4-epimerase
MNSVETRIIAISSAAVYGAKYKGPISEDSRLSPYSPYGVHKAMMEDLCRSYSENFGLNTAIVRLFSVYGAGLEKQLIWDLCSKLLASKDNNIVLGGTGNELRDWLHVEDAIRLLTLVGKQAGTSCPVFNGGTGIATSIRSIAEIVCQAWGGDHRIEFNGVARKGDPESLVADVFKYQILDFIPKINIQEGLSGVVAWFKSRASV